MNHREIYYAYFGCFDCELTGTPGGDVHHIDARGMGGNPDKSKDVIENLMCLRRDAHEYFGDKKHFKPWLREVHADYMERRVPKHEEPDEIFIKFLYDNHTR